MPNPVFGIDEAARFKLSILNLKRVASS